MIEPDGLIEVKCPATATHVETLLGEKIANKYMLQMQFQMAVTSRQWCDFVSFDPRLPAEFHLWIKRVPRDEALIGKIESAVSEFLRQLDDKVVALQRRYLPSADVKCAGQPAGTVEDEPHAVPAGARSGVA